MIRPVEIAIGELSRRTGCKPETVRYYERIGLIPPPPRSAGRYRLYGGDDVRRLAFVRRARELGFTLDEVRALLALALNRTGRCASARDLAAAHAAGIRAKIADLRAMERALNRAVERCASGRYPGCPVIETLSAGAASRAGAAARPRRG